MPRKKVSQLLGKPPKAEHTVLAQHRGWVLASYVGGRDGWVNMKLYNPTRNAAGSNIWLGWSVIESRLSAGPYAHHLKKDFPELAAWVVAWLETEFEIL